MKKAVLKHSFNNGNTVETLRKHSRGKMNFKKRERRLQQCGAFLFY